jgi:mannose-6-phosphate isomerase-like protein (cupin superfamily)
MKTTRILGSGITSATKSAIEDIELDAGERIPFKVYPEEKIYYFLSGRGLMNVYDEGAFSDVYEVRQDTAIWVTPGLGHSIENKGHHSMKYIVINALGKTGETAPNFSHKVTRVFDEHSNPARQEGLNLMIRPIQIGTSKRFLGAEVNIIAPRGTSRPHVHSETEENNYVIVGEGVFHINEEKIPCGSGSTQSYPPGTVRRLENTGSYPLNYINYLTYS